MHFASSLIAIVLTFGWITTAFSVESVATDPAAYKTVGEVSGVPPAPAGFASQDEVLKALAAGKVKIVTPSFAPPEGIEETKDIVYCTVGDTELKMDICRPKGVTTPRPAIIFIHGGGWSGGDRAIMALYTYHFAEKGYVTATISYRFSGKAPFPAAVSDAKCAVRFLKANAEKYGIDPDNIAASGNSAGGHLSMMMGYSSDVPELESDCAIPSTDSSIKAVINFYGPTDLTTDFAISMGVVKKFIGKPYEDAKEAYKLASPLTHLTPDDPPTLIFQGTVDDIVPVSQADILAAKLQELGIPYEYDRVEGWPHTMDLAAEVNARCVVLMERFLEEHLPIR